MSQTKAPRGVDPKTKDALVRALDRSTPTRKTPEKSAGSENVKSLACKISVETHRALKQAALDRDTTLSAILEEAIGEWFAKYAKAKR